MKEIKKKDEVERFLKQFLPKLDIWGIIYIDREKNDAALRAAQQQDYLYLVPRVRVQIDYAFKKQKRR